jgi:hypothetical protein
MIVHIALFRWKSTATKMEIEYVMAQICELKTKIPGLIDIKCGENFSK